MHRLRIIKAILKNKAEVPTLPDNEIYYTVTVLSLCSIGTRKQNGQMDQNRRTEKRPTHIGNLIFKSNGTDRAMMERLFFQ